MTNKEFLAKLLEETQKDPGLLTLTVIRCAIRDLTFNENATVIDALLRIRQDLDKFLKNEFGTWLHEATAIAQAHFEIERENKATNNGRGSKTAKDMCKYLETLDLRSVQLLFECDGDKIRQYPQLEQTIVSSIVGCRLHGKRYCSHWLCEK